MQIVKDDPKISLFITLTSPEYIMAIKDEDAKKYIEHLRSAISPETNKLLISAPALHSVSQKTVESIVKYRSMLKPYNIMVYNSVDEAAKCCYRLWKYGKYLENNAQF